jgi:hypothetical protein
VLPFVACTAARIGRIPNVRVSPARIDATPTQQHRSIPLVSIPSLPILCNHIVARASKSPGEESLEGPQTLERAVMKHIEREAAGNGRYLCPKWFLIGHAIEARDAHLVSTAYCSFGRNLFGQCPLERRASNSKAASDL